MAGLPSKHSRKSLVFLLKLDLIYCPDGTRGSCPTEGQCLKQGFEIEVSFLDHEGVLTRKGVFFLAKLDTTPLKVTSGQDGQNFPTRAARNRCK